MKAVYHELLTRLMPIIRQDEKYIFAVPNCSVIRESCLKLYLTFPPLESLPIEEKKDLWNYVCGKVKGTKEERVEVTKIVYVISQYL